MLTYGNPLERWTLTRRDETDKDTIDNRKLRLGRNLTDRRIVLAIDWVAANMHSKGPSTASAVHF